MPLQEDYACNPAVASKMEDRTRTERNKHRQKENCDLEKDP
jgi:hypothetical protein